MKVPMIWKGPSKRFSGLPRVRSGDAVQIPANQAAFVRAKGWATDVPVAVPEEVVYTPPPTRQRARTTAQTTVKEVQAAKAAAAKAVDSDEDIEKLRAQYEAKKGEAPDKRWGLRRLMRELGGRTYQRRDMRATED